MSFSPGDIKKVITDEDDFGHEMRVGRILNDFKDSQDATPVSIIDKIQHGGTYTDSITGKPRQFDYRCQIECRALAFPPPSRRVLMAVECKNLYKSSPLVVCGIPRDNTEAYHGFIHSECTKSTNWIWTHTNKTDGPSSFYQPHKFVGKSLLRLRLDEKSGKLKTDTQSDIYDRWSQALASSVELAESACQAAREYNNDMRSVVLPIVVVPDESLWMAEYDRNGAIQTNPAARDSCEFFIGRKIDIGERPGLHDKRPFIFSHIHFVTLRGFSALLTSLMKSTVIWDQFFPLYASPIQIPA
jgi:hypothetical protein